MKDDSETGSRAGAGRAEDVKIFLGMKRMDREYIHGSLLKLPRRRKRQRPKRRGEKIFQLDSVTEEDAESRRRWTSLPPFPLKGKRFSD